MQAYSYRRLLCSLTTLPRNFAQSSRLVFTTRALDMPIKVGEKLPDATLFEDNPGNAVKTSELCDGKVVVFGVPGAFTPTCSNDHAPGFVKKIDALKDKGVKSIVCISVNDPFVMHAWAKSLGAIGKVRFLADISADLSVKLGLAFDAKPVLGSVRSKRYAMVLENGVVKAISVEPDGTGLSCSRVDDVLKLV